MIAALLIVMGLTGAPVLAQSASLQAPAESTPPSQASPLLAEPPLGDPPQPAEAERRAAALSAGFRCPVCQALSVADSDADAARAMAARIRALVDAGYTDDQITDYFVDRYGEWIELEPPAEGIHWVIFGGPLAALGLGGLVVVGRLRPAPPSPAAPSPAPPTETPTLTEDDDPYRRQILAELEQR